MRKSKQSKMRKISNNILNIHESITQTCNQWIFSDCNKILRERLWLWPPSSTDRKPCQQDNLWTSDTTQHQQETTYLGAWLNITVYYLQEASEHHQTSFTCLLSAHNNHIINPGWVLASGGHQVCALLLGSIFLHASSRWRWISGDWSGGVQSLSVHCPIKRFP